MSEPKWTPGAWFLPADQYPVVECSTPLPDDRRYLIPVVRGRDDEERKANARLITASKDLYKAAAAGLGLLTGNMDGDLPADADPVQMLRAALAKAADGGEG